ncbi:hypothetical protein H312_01993 [Anncaliia algerae PRA339]|uniref:Uncharacterized protein n=1 Tax=Anncaliia algerae PRA339 TaxID=1288291 RepID=A0A059F027_9MICR|nr:hypothetical protein H312_01993 [Anncaliia algerae PRA339]
MVLMIFLPQIKYIFGTSSFIQLEDKMGQHRNNKRKFDVLSADSWEEHEFDQFPCPNSNLQDGCDVFNGNDKADSFPSYFKKIKNQVNFTSLDQQNESRTNEDFEKMKNKNNEKDELIKILNQYAQTQDEHIKLCIENFNKLIEFDTLFYSLNSFTKLTKYLRHKSNDKNSPKTSLDWEYDIYFDCFKLLVTFLFNKILVSKHFFVNGDKIENKTNVKPIEDAKFTDYLDCILASYWSFSHYIELEASKILVKLCNGFRMFVINVENQENISLKVVYEILGWLKTTYLYFYFKSELNCIETNLSKIDIYKCTTLATQLCCFHFYSLKTIVKNNLFSGTIMTENEYLEMLKNEAFLADLISLKYILREIIGNVFKKKLLSCRYL